MTHIRRRPVARLLLPGLDSAYDIDVIAYREWPYIGYTSATHTLHIRLPEKSRGDEYSVHDAQSI